MMETTRIKEVIFMENELLTIANEEVKRIKAILKPFLDKPVLKVDGSLLKKVKDLIEFNTDNRVRPLKKGGHVSLNLWLEPSIYSIWLRVKLCFSGGSYDDKTYYCMYWENSFYIADIEKLHLKDLGELDKVLY